MSSHSLIFNTTLIEDMNRIVQSDVVDTNSRAGHCFTGPDEQPGINEHLFCAVDDNAKSGTWMQR
ncbi:MAG: hypothetical protein MK102_00660 [Fuerstiella sp.]|nr:hypothetical protein [Fuerstiella sp.]